VRTQRSANAFAFGARTGVEDGLDADRGEDLIETGGELGVAVTDDDAHSPASVLELAAEVAGRLGHPGATGVGGDTEEVHDASFHLDHEQHVITTKCHRIDGEKKSVATMA
jgi:hypothetical protein